MSSESNEELVRSVFITLSSGDLERVSAFLDDSSTWTVCATEIPGAGTHTGKAIVEEFLGPVRGMYEPGEPKVEVTNLVATDSWVAVEATGRGQFRSGTPYENHYAFWLAVDDQKIRTIREHMDTQYIALLTP